VDRSPFSTRQTVMREALTLAAISDKEIPRRMRASRRRSPSATARRRVWGKSGRWGRDMSHRLDGWALSVQSMRHSAAGRLAG
jgi:hypothetical protein